MRVVTIFRIAAIIATIQFVAHTYMFLTYVPSHGADEVQVINTMKEHTFTFGGHPRTYWDFYFGYGLFAAVLVAVEVGVLLAFAGIARVNPKLVRNGALVLAVANIGYAALVRTYFFPLPSYFDIALAALMIFAAWRTRYPEEIAMSGNKRSPPEISESKLPPHPNPKDPEHDDWVVDEADEESFPASDPSTATQPKPKKR
jgi:hypothetical protein